jgi:hypothetical protein
VAYKLLLGNDLKTNTETTVVVMQQSGKHDSTIELLLETVLCNPLLGSCNSWTTTMETGVSVMSSIPRSYLEDNWGDPVRRHSRVKAQPNTSTVALRGLRRRKKGALCLGV